MELITVKSPLTGEIIGKYPITKSEEIVQVFEKAQKAFEIWKETTIEERIGYLRKIKYVIVEEVDEIVKTIMQNTGKVAVEALTGDVFTTIELINYYEKHAEDIISPQERDGHFIFFGSKFFVEYMPFGVVAVISPWNYPFQLSFIPIITALIAGNSVVFKPSSITAPVGDLIDNICKKAGLPDNLVNVVQGGSRVGEDIINTKPDLIFFTGSVEIGKKIMEAASRQLIPVVLELGGKDPMIVFDDANFTRAVKGALYGAFANTGQICVSVERLYVQNKIYDRFVDAVTLETKKIRVGSGVEADIGTLINPSQKDIIDDHIKDALEKGAIVTNEQKTEGNFYYPVVLKNVNHKMKVMTEETFGPVLPIMPFKDEKEAIMLANDSNYGLNSSVWTKDIDKGLRVAHQLIVGNCAINDVVKNIGNPDVPFGGVKQSGIGRYHGREGLYAFTRPKSIMINRGKTKKEINWFPYTSKIYESLKTYIYTIYGGKNSYTKGKMIFDTIIKITKNT